MELKIYANENDEIKITLCSGKSVTISEESKQKIDRSPLYGQTTLKDRPDYFQGNK